jgi:hypothetical protein
MPTRRRERTLTKRTSIEGGVSTLGDAERNERFQQMLQEVLPEVRRRHPAYSDERVFVTAVHLAAYRLWKDVVPCPEPEGAA